MRRILIVEDDRYLCEGLCMALKAEDTAILQCGSLQEAGKALADGEIDLVLLDINLPDGSGMDLLCKLKKTQNIPVILLTANDAEMDVVLGLEQGADDYITKPFSLAILRARVNAQLRRLEKKTPSAVEIADYSFDFDSMVFSCHGERVELSKTEQKLLRLLIENIGTTLPRALLLERVWPDGTAFVDENTLSVSIKRLRDKLHAGKYIKTVYGLGYVWAVD